MMMLRCSNPACESREEENPMFNVNITVYADFEVSERICKIESKYFECVYCQAKAEEVSDG
tara:strand:+ start:10337 stop:10519 length:183 start_codon:yes stop_codon:yes gene_type:complete